MKQLHFALVIAVLVPCPRAMANLVIAPTSDGTLVDGGGYGNFDGVGDAADWTFNESSYEGAVTLSHTSVPPIEHRLVFEFNLSSVTAPAPVVAGFKIKLRGAAQFPGEKAVVQVFSYPSDLVEGLNDFSAGPAVLVGQFTVAPFTPPTVYEVDVSDPVNAALESAAKRVAIRVQLAPQTQSTQAFMDALDTDVSTKPSIVVYDTVPGDLNQDGSVDAGDLVVLVSCMNGPGMSFPAGCSKSDFTGNGRVDLNDVRVFEEKQAIFGH